MGVTFRLFRKAAGDGGEVQQDIRLTLSEARVIGALMEKETTTPDQYPLSLNALKLACNQKTSRDPVMSLTDDQVRETLDSLRKKHLVLERSGFGSRVPKFKQRFCNTEFSSLQFTDHERSIVCALLLRGPQTPGQLRTNTHRLCDFTDVSEVERTLQSLAERSDGPFVKRLSREPGKRESRFCELFSERAEHESDATAEADETSARDLDEPSGGVDRMHDLENRVTALEEEIKDIKRRLFTDPFE